MVFLPMQTFILMIVLQSHVVLSVIQVDIACPTFIQPSVGQGALIYHGSAYEMAVEECNRMYSGIFNFTLTPISGDSDAVRSAQDFVDQTSGLLAKWYFSRLSSPRTVSAVISPGTMDYTTTDQLMAPANILCCATMGYFKSQYSLQPPPAWVSTSFVTPPFIAQTLTNLLLYYAWTTVYVITDHSSTFFYRGMMSEMDKGMSMTPIIFYRRELFTKITPSFKGLLNEFRNLSRVFFGRAEQLRRLMIDASALNLTNGDYVYICDEPYAWLKSFGIVTWQSDGGVDDEIAREAFRSVLVVHPYEALDMTLPTALALAQGFRQRTAHEYGINYTAFEQPTRELFSSYATIFMFAQVLNETLSTQGKDRLHDGRWLAMQFRNRTFHAAGGLFDIYIANDGNRLVTLQVSHFAGNTSSREAFLVQSIANKLVLDLVHNVNVSAGWPGGQWPPPNEPFCGYHTENQNCRANPRFWQNGGLAVLLTLTCLIVIALVVARTRKHVYEIEQMSVWWRLCAEYLHLPALPSRTTKCSVYDVLKAFCPPP